MIATKASLAVLVLLLLFGNAASRPLRHRSDDVLARNALDSGFAKEISTPLSLNGDDPWTKSNLLSKRDTTGSLVQAGASRQEDVSVGFDTDAIGPLITGFLNAVLNLVTFNWSG